MSRRRLLMLLALSAIWGASFAFIQVRVRELDPITTVAGLGLVLGGVARGTGALRPLRLALGRARISADTLRP